MCLIGLAFDAGGNFTLVANRDEFADRPAQPLHWWNHRVLAGRDLQAHGTWLGVTRDGRFAAVTNVRDPSLKTRPIPHGSRGRMVSHYLEGHDRPEQFLVTMRDAADGPSPFNLIAGHITPGGVECWWYGGRAQTIEAMAEGVHVLSNAELNTPWPKALQLQIALDRHAAGSMDEGLMSVLCSRAQAPDQALPSTGVGYDWEKKLSAAFITGSDYHTRCTTRIVHRRGEMAVDETSWSASGDAVNRVTMRFEVGFSGQTMTRV